MTSEMEADCRHVAPSDNRFTARMRFHQSWYRRHILGLSPGPGPRGGTIYGNQLTAEDGNAGRNFLTEEIWSVVQNRISEDRGIVNVGDKDRLLRNLLSSQPMCFNLFAPLKNDLTLATRLMQALPGVPANITVTNVEIEFAPRPKRYYLNDATAFDAFVEYQRAGEIRGFIGIETKLTEPFSQRSYEFKEGYSRWRTPNGWWWRGRARTYFPDKRYNQLWRNQLLAFAMHRRNDAEYDEALFAVLYHDNDLSCVASLDAYHQRLTQAGKDALLEWTLSEVVNRWEAQASNQAHRKWLAGFRLRYLDIEASQAALGVHGE